MTQVVSSYAPPRVCPDCGTELSPALLSCPRCRRLVHRDRLNQLAEYAKQASAAGDVAGALAAWREAQTLLPPESKQFAGVSATISALTREIDTRGLRAAPATVPPPPPPPPGAGQSSGQPGHPHHSGSTAGKAAGAAGAFALLLWKLKFVLVFVLTKAKLLLFGLTKASTFFSMLLSMGVYWAAFGWKFAVGLVLSIYVHEMGHVWMLRRYGFKATAPMFIPGLGALIRLQQHPADRREDAMIGLAGPVWGLAAAAFCYAVWLATKWPAWAAIASVGAWVNLFNLLPVWQLDGSRGFRALSKAQRWTVVATIGAMLMVTHEFSQQKDFEGMLILLTLVAVIRIFVDPEKAPEAGDKRTAYLFVFLVIALSLLSEIHVPVDAL
jgi:Zn-dependent protease